MQLFTEQFAEEKKVMNNNKSLLDKIRIGLEFEFIVDPNKFKSFNHLGQIDISSKTDVRKNLVLHFNHEFQDYLSNGFSVVDQWKYHSTTDPTQFRFEIDSSVKPDIFNKDGYDFGVELVTPALTYSQQLEITDRILKYMEDVGGYTNSTCGLHINLSNIDHRDVNFWVLFSFYDEQFYQVNFRKIKFNQVNKYQMNMFTDQVSNSMKNLLQITKTWGVDKSLRPRKLIIQDNLQKMITELISNINNEILYKSINKYTSAHTKIFTDNTDNRTNLQKIPGIEFRLLGNEYTNLKYTMKQIYYLQSQYQISCYLPEDQMKVQKDKYNKLVMKTINRMNEIDMVSTIKDKNYYFIITPYDISINDKNTIIDRNKIKNIEEPEKKLPSVIKIKKENTIHYIYLRNDLSLKSIETENILDNSKYEIIYNPETFSVDGIVNYDISKGIYTKIFFYGDRKTINVKETFSMSHGSIIKSERFTPKGELSSKSETIYDKEKNYLYYLITDTKNFEINQNLVTTEFFNKIEEILLLNMSNELFPLITTIPIIYTYKKILMQSVKFALNHGLGIKITPEGIEYNYESSSYNTFVAIRFINLFEFVKLIIKKDDYFYHYYLFKDSDTNVYYLLNEIESILDGTENFESLTHSFNNISMFLEYSPDKYVKEDFKLLLSSLHVPEGEYVGPIFVYSNPQFVYDIYRVSDYTKIILLPPRTFIHIKLDELNFDDIVNKNLEELLQPLMDKGITIYEQFLSPFSRSYMISKIFYQTRELREIIVRSQYEMSKYEVIVDVNFSKDGKYNIKKKVEKRDQ